jgi:cell division protein FtsQ
MLWAATAVSVVSVLGYAAYWTWTSPIFKVSNVEVVGNERIATSTIVEKVGLLGESMFDANLASAQEALYRQPLVNSVRIERDWPHSIRVVVEERTPGAPGNSRVSSTPSTAKGLYSDRGPPGRTFP